MEEANLAQMQDDEPALLITEKVLLVDEGKVMPKLCNNNAEKQSDSNLWYLDNGASNHMSGKLCKLKEMDQSIKGQLAEDGNKVILNGEYLWVYEEDGKLIMKQIKQLSSATKVRWYEVFIQAVFTVFNLNTGVNRGERENNNFLNSQSEQSSAFENNPHSGQSSRNEGDSGIKSNISHSVESTPPSGNTPPSNHNSFFNSNSELSSEEPRRYKHLSEIYDVVEEI
ncbi:hypothetical protein AgCh_026305 [Apium graveolens]